MAAGADRIIAFDPPGAIGLSLDRAAVLLRFDEVDDAIFVKDAAGSLQDLGVVDTAFNMPAVVDGATGRAREFGEDNGLVAVDIEPGSSLITRDCTIQVILAWDIAGQDALNGTGAIVARGTGGSLSEYTAYGLRVDVVDAASFTGELRWFWQDVAGVDKLQSGAQFTITPDTFTMLTATRRWISPTEVLIRYFVGDIMIGEVTSADGSIGGATTGTFMVGAYPMASPNFLVGRVDELLILDHEITLQEIEATWLRITVYQPRGYQLMREMHPRGFPLPTDPASDVQLDLRMTGMALGYAAALAENVREYIMPQRAFGSVLEDWEETVRVTPEPRQDVDTRRARVLAKIRQRRGSSIPGIGDALQGLIDADLDDLEFIAYSNRWTDAFDAEVDPTRWDVTAGVAWNAGTARFAPGAGSYPLLASPMIEGWKSIATSVSRSSELVGNNGEHAIVKVALSTPQAGVEVGIWFGNRATADYVTLGLLDDAGTFKIVTESYSAGVSLGQVVRATLGGNPAALWLHLFQSGTTWTAAWSTTSATSGFTTSPSFAGPTLMHWSGCYMRSTGAIGAAVASFDDFQLYMPDSNRPSRAYIFRDTGLGGDPDLDGSESVIQSIKHAFIEAHLVESMEFRLSTDPLGIVPIGPPL